MISVVLATYCGAEYIIEFLDSIKNQSISPDEVLICDDKSSDNTFEIIKEYIKKHGLINWRLTKNNENIGYQKNFTKLLYQASGDIIFFADQDDVWSLNKIEIMSKIMLSSKNILLLASDVEPLYMSEKAPKVNYQRFLKKIVKFNFNSSWIKPIRPGCTYSITRRLIDFYKELWEEGIPHDCALWNVASVEEGAYYLNKKLIKYRRHNNNASNLGCYKLSYRLECIKQEIFIMEKELKNKNLSNDKKLFIQKQLSFYNKRVRILETGNLIYVIGLASGIKYYSRFRLYLTDIFYCLRHK